MNTEIKEAVDFVETYLRFMKHVDVSDVLAIKLLKSMETLVVGIRDLEKENGILKLNKSLNTKHE